MLPLRHRPLLCLGLAAVCGCTSPPSKARPPERPALATAPADMLAASALAVERNAGLAAARERAQAAGASADAAGRLPNPRLAWTEFAEELQTRTGPHVRRIGLRQRLPWPGTLSAARETASAAAAGAQGVTRALAAATRLELESAWIERAQLSTEQQLQQARIELLEGLEPIVAARTRAGAGRQDLLRLEVEVARATDKLVQLQSAAAPLDAQLAELLATPVPLIPIDPLPEPEDLDLPADLEARVLSESPRLAAPVARIDEAKNRAQLRSKQRLPGFGLGIDWLQVDGALDPSAPGSGQDPLALMVELDLPVWTASDDATEREAAHALRAAHLDLEAQQRSLQTDLSRVLFAAHDAQRRRHLHRDALLPRADESLRLVTSAYRAGAATLLEVLELERLRLDLQVDLARAGTDQRIALARLRALLGEDQ